MTNPAPEVMRIQPTPAALVSQGKFNLGSFTISTDQPWRVRDRSGRVELSFRPEVERVVDVNALIMRSRYRGPFGSFAGHIVDDRGNRVSVENCYGMGEDFYLRA